MPGRKACVVARVIGGRPPESSTLPKHTILVGGDKRQNGPEDEDGAGCQTRTDDLPLTRRLLYQLS